MRRFILAGAIAAAVVFGAAPASASAASCANSFTADGHAGPWWDPTPGGVHGNIVHIDCPSGSTHWDINYKIQFQNGAWMPWFNQHRSGNGSPADFAYLVPTSCDGGLHPWRTHIDNNVTGGNINKPSGGSGVFLGC